MSNHEDTPETISPFWAVVIVVVVIIGIVLVGLLLHKLLA